MGVFICAEFRKNLASSSRENSHGISNCTAPLWRANARRNQHHRLWRPGETSTRYYQQRAELSLGRVKEGHAVKCFTRVIEISTLQVHFACKRMRFRIHASL